MTRRPVNTAERSADLKWRMARLEKHVIGTEENNWQDGLVVWRADIEKNFKQVKQIVHIWGGALLAGLLASGLLNHMPGIGAFLTRLGQ